MAFRMEMKRPNELRIHAARSGNKTPINGKVSGSIPYIDPRVDRRIIVFRLYPKNQICGVYKRAVDS